MIIEVRILQTHGDSAGLEVFSMGNTYTQTKRDFGPGYSACLHALGADTAARHPSDWPKREHSAAMLAFACGD